MSKVILITGATDGLGKLAAQKLLMAGNTVIITGRSKEKLEATATWLRQQQKEQNNTTSEALLYTLLLDLTSLESVRQAVDSFESLGINKKIDVLINNAGTTTQELEYVSETKVVEKTIFVNAVAPWYFTQLLLPHINDNDKDSRIIFITSSLHDPKVRGGRNSKNPMPTDLTLDYLDGQNAWESMLFYKVSKVTQIWLALVLAKQEKGKRKVMAICPGFVPTTQLNRNTSWIVQFIMYHVLSRMSFATSEEDAANDYLYYAHDDQKEEEQEDDGGLYYYRKRKIEEPSVDANNMDKAKEFWNKVCDICHVPDKKL
ncbi:hypothetical protein BDC45DRAFT_568858 [Circinella umbellata]|nr:hypothetical protein BDC45DRAFT_568858 [Circinella umbellata]